MTGIYVRVHRDGAWLNLECDQLTDAELEAFAAAQPVEQGWLWAMALARWIRDHGQEATVGPPMTPLDTP